MDNIITLAGKFKSHIELQEYADAQYLALKQATDRIKLLQDEVEHLKSLLVGAVPMVGQGRVESFIVAPEQTIAEIEIARLQERVTKGESLEFEDVKKYDLYVKNLLLIRAQNNAIPAEGHTIPADIDEAKLLEIAAIPPTE